MEPPLLATKITIPPARHGLVQRPRLLHALQSEVPRLPLVVVSAPAGYGKTSLLAQWAGQQRNGDLSVAWLSLDEADDDVERFFRYLLASWEQVQPGVMDSPLGVLLGAMMPDSEAVLSAFINQGHEREDDLVFVLDDYHLIREPAIHNVLTFLLDHLPPSLHFLLACRAEPPLPLARYRARRQLFELRTADLDFSTEETFTFLKESMGLDLDAKRADRLHEQCEGWIAGLQLAALTLRESVLGQQLSDDGETAIIVRGRQRFIADYLAQDVLAKQKPPVRDFLLCTSILERFNGSLCDAVTDGQDSHEMLERLERDNLFLEALDDSRDWYRYHRLFAEFLQEEARRRLPAPELATLHRRAGLWHLEHDMARPAFHHAVASEDLELTIRVAERYFFVKLHNGEMGLLNQWLDMLPEAWYTAYPTFALARAGILAFTGELDASLRFVQEVEESLVPPQTEQQRWQLGRATAVRCFMACFKGDVSHAEDYASQALAALPEEDLTFRADTYQALGDAYRRYGRWDDAEACYRKVLEFAAAPTFHELSIHAYGALADLELRKGRLRNAARYWRKSLQVIEEPQSWGNVPLDVSGWAHVRLAEILYEWNELRDAQQHLARGLQRAELGGDVRARIAGYLLSARLNLTAGELQAAANDLEKAHLLLEGSPFPLWDSRFQRLQLELWLAEDRLRAALHWADDAAQSLAVTGDKFSPPLRSDDFSRLLALARILIVKGDDQSLRQASATLRTVLPTLEDQSRLGLQIEALALQALCHWQHGNHPQALTALERALRLAQPEGYTRLFLDLGPPLPRLLQEAQSRDVLPDAVSPLLATFGHAAPATSPAPLAEPLTPREEEVLQLLAAGLTNREIGEQLVISPQTVKKHAGNIYGKLGVGNRTEAVARARELNLLD